MKISFARQIILGFLIGLATLISGNAFGMGRGWHPGTSGWIPAPNPSQNGSCYVERFSAKRKMDILIVYDPLSFDWWDRDRVAEHLGEFIEELPRGSDFRVGVLLALGSENFFSGKLVGIDCEDPFRLGCDRPWILDSKKMGREWIEQSLDQILTHPWQDVDDFSLYPGQEGLFALSNATTGKKLKFNTDNGFFRKEAALSVVFVSARADACSDPTNKVAKKDCSTVSPASVLAQLRAIKGSEPVIASGVIYNDPAFKDTDFDRDHGDEHYGAGYADFIHLDKGESVDLAHPNYAEGLEQISRYFGRERHEDEMEFDLSHSPVIPSTISVDLLQRRDEDGDGDSDRFDPLYEIPVPFTYDASDNSVVVDIDHRRCEDHHKFWVQVSYCVGTSPSPTPSPSSTVTPAPSTTPTSTSTSTPTPTPTPTPSASPSPSPSPSASPSASPSPSPKPSPSPSVSPTVTPSPSATPTPSTSPSPSATPTPSPSLSVSPSSSPSSPAPSPSSSPSVSPTASPSPTVSPSPSTAPSTTPTPSPSATPTTSPSPSASPSSSPSSTPTPSSSPSASPTASPSPSPTACSGPLCGIFGN